MKGNLSAYRKLLWPFTMLYGIVIRSRNWMFDVNILKSKSYFTPLINVGNITVGGTGKTPHIEYLIRLLTDSYVVSTLSRGYKRETKGFIMANKSHTYAQIGDEPKQIKSQFPDVLVSVDSDRCRGVENLEKLDNRPDVILLDDAFQHRYIKPGLNILLTDYFNPYWNDQLLPVGNLRDSKLQARRADIVIVSKTPKSISPIKKRIIKKELKLFPYQNLFFTTIKYGNLVAFGKPVAGDLSKDYNVLMLTGIAKSSHLKNYLKANFNKVISKTYPDHHSFTSNDVKEIVKVFNTLESDKKILITTLKDAVRLKDNAIFAELSKLPIYYQPIEVGFLNSNDQKEFNELISKYVRNAKGDGRVY